MACTSSGGDGGCESGDEVDEEGRCCWGCFGCDGFVDGGGDCTEKDDGDDCDGGGRYTDDFGSFAAIAAGDDKGIGSCWVTSTFIVFSTPLASFVLVLVPMFIDNAVGLRLALEEGMSITPGVFFTLPLIALSA